ncbi:carbohydrate esterase family 1 protein [Piromyces sp. E2]|nr:carbohydrate esterase family 1 protein [Piromyces sp. E2]|eukprot:OUM70474.1 carbohydrate esterase family 1 protein [Piromyces sp. E2]
MKNITLLSLIASSFSYKVLANCYYNKFGLPCCQYTTNVVFSDNNGSFGVENGQLCGIVQKNNATNCWASALGYPCCTSTSKVYYTDNSGNWGVENGKWCGIIESSTTTSDSQPSSSSSSASNNQSENMVEIARNYMKKINPVHSLPSFNGSNASVIVENVSYNSKTTGTTRPLNIILPENYSKDKKYPVFYFLHGLFGDENSLLTNVAGPENIPANLFKEGKAKEMIIVLPSVYAPAPGTAIEPCYKQEHFDGYDNFINDLVNDLMPFIESNYSVLTGRENTAIAGFSMGGRTALYIGYSRPDLFGYVAAFSPAPGVVETTDKFTGYHKGLFASESDFTIMEPTKYTPYVTIISCGTADSVVFDFPKSYHQILDTNGQYNIWIEVPGSDHDDYAINVGLYNFLTSIFGILN